MSDNQPGGAMRPVIEVRSIDYVPRNERHGKVWHQGPFWFAGNFVIMTLMIGFIGPSMSLGAFYSVLAILLGVAFGTLFMAFHANQGPTMGLPQMIQSRAQFGVRGVVLPLLAVYFCYTGFNVFNAILATDAVQTVVAGPREPWYFVWTLAAAVIAIFGHDLLHRFQRWLTYLIVTVYALLSVAAVIYLTPDAAVKGAGFSLDAFLVQLGAAAGYQISYSVYVSDYSRYLPHDTPARRIITWTYLGALISAVWMMSLGALIASALPEPSAIGSLREIGNRLVPGFGTFAVLVSVPAILGIMAVNFYGAMLTSITALDAFRSIAPTLKSRVLGIALAALIALAISLAIPDRYMATFNTFIMMMLYALIPWTAVNLVDFYCVRRGHYAISEIFNPDGIYGKWSGNGLSAYFLGILAMVPFMSLSFYVGPGAQALGGADITFVVGLAVSGLAYFLIAKRRCSTEEWRRVRESEVMLEGR
ncbi:purine-cytosine permease family protein [Pseudomonas nitroreducens]|uniref:purine-cytosine permease family protein n=1 Tax=Pseudomonas nitroreducens TaxID=46680 RepID=UPI002658DA7E|nr:cytosine permease [Pseudomonas nitroreducens]MCP1647989.1 purine-cytosine permease-like protein [Pseudomonas nitroreducens]